MKIKISAVFLLSVIFLVIGNRTVLALEHSQKDGLFKMDIPKEWHWMEYAHEIIITYPDGKTMAMDIQLVPSRPLSEADIKKTLKEGVDRMVKDGIEAHQGTLIDNKEIDIDGVYATRLDFKTVPPNPVYVTCISVFNKGFALTVTYGSEDDKMHSMLDDTFATFRFK